MNSSVGSIVAESNTSTNFRIRNNTNTFPCFETNASNNIYFNTNSEWLNSDFATLNVLWRTTPLNHFSCQPINISSSSSTVRDACLYIDRNSNSRLSKNYALHIVDPVSGESGGVFLDNAYFHTTGFSRFDNYSYFGGPSLFIGAGITRTDIVGAPISVGSASSYSIVANGIISGT